MNPFPFVCDVAKTYICGTYAELIEADWCIYASLI